MAERALYIIPANPLFTPTPEACQKALEFFKEVSPLPNANGDYYFRVYKTPVLIDSGEGLEAIVCPHCGEKLDIYEHDDWWDEVQNDINSVNAQVLMPCCGSMVAPLDFKFDSECGFAQFVVGALEPSTSDYWEDELSLKSSTIDHFELLLGSKVMVFWSIQ